MLLIGIAIVLLAVQSKLKEIAYELLRQNSCDGNKTFGKVVAQTFI